jgi:hypothetical protein
VIETPENEPIEPTETVEPEPDVEFVVDPKKTKASS